jgi:RNA polymerase-binding protein DksA
MIHPRRSSKSAEESILDSTMDKRTRDALEGALRSRREALWHEVASEEERLAALGEERESELEERAQEEVAARVLDRLDERGKREIEAIDAALQRMQDGSYGQCGSCGKAISVARLEALPETSLCGVCTNAAERERRAERESSQTRNASDEFAMHEHVRLTDQEVTTLLLDRFDADDRIDNDDLDLECRAGVVHLSGTLPSHAQHELLRQELMEVLGFCDLDDRIEIGGITWEEQEPPSSEVAEEEEPAESPRDRKR